MKTSLKHRKVEGNQQIRDTALGSVHSSLMVMTLAISHLGLSESSHQGGGEFIPKHHEIELCNEGYQTVRSPEWSQMSSWPWAKWPGTAVLCHHPDSSVCTAFPLEKLSGAKLPSLVAQLHLNPSLCRAWATAGPWAPWRTTNQVRWGWRPELSWDRYVLPSRGDFLHSWPSRPPAPTLNTYCPALSNICPGQINFSLLIEMGLFPKKKKPTQKCHWTCPFICLSHSVCLWKQS